METVILESWNYDIPENAVDYESDEMESILFDKNGNKLIRYISHNVFAHNFVIKKLNERNML
jgi:hypothetical protein